MFAHLDPGVISSAAQFHNPPVESHCLIKVAAKKTKHFFGHNVCRGEEVTESGRRRQEEPGSPPLISMTFCDFLCLIGGERRKPAGTLFPPLPVHARCGLGRPTARTS